MAPPSESTDRVQMVTDGDARRCAGVFSGASPPRLPGAAEAAGEHGRMDRRRFLLALSAGLVTAAAGRGAVALGTEDTVVSPRAHARAPHRTAAARPVAARP